MSIVGEFKKFIMRGNLVDLAIGFTVGAAFTTVAKSLVNDVIMPPIGLLVGRVDFKDLFWILREGEKSPAPYATIEMAQEAGAVTLNYGMFLNNLIALLLVALVMFIIIRFYNRLEDSMEERLDGKKPPQEPDQKKCPFCRSNIPYRASRCPACTSNIEESEGAQLGVGTHPPTS